MNINKAIKRDNKRNKNKNGMQEDGRSNKYIEKLKRERAIRIKLEREEKEKLQNTPV
jgi:hypothetical protein